MFHVWNGYHEVQFLEAGDPRLFSVLQKFARAERKDIRVLGDHSAIAIYYANDNAGWRESFWLIGYHEDQFSVGQPDEDGYYDMIGPRLGDFNEFVRKHAPHLAH